MDDETIAARLRLLLPQYGATEPQDLMRQVARHLGFQRMGPRIAELIAEEFAMDGSVIGMTAR